jgi:hypothetical protein
VEAAQVAASEHFGEEAAEALAQAVVPEAGSMLSAWEQKALLPSLAAQTESLAEPL